MEFFNNIGENLNLITFLYSGLVVIGIICCCCVYIFGGDDGGIDDGGLTISPTGLAFFTTSLGAFGLISYHGFKTTALTSMLISVVLSLIMMFIFNYVFFKAFVESGFTVKDETLEGLNGEVYTAIPENGTGEIVYKDSRGRQKSLARELEGRPLAMGTSVTIKKIVGATLIVVAVEADNGKKG